MKERAPDELERAIEDIAPAVFMGSDFGSMPPFEVAANSRGVRRR
jgi:hypothetical protein